MMVLDRCMFDQFVCVLFADDLVFFFKDGQTIDDFLQGNSIFAFSGIQFAPEKCGWVDKELKFLGSKLNLENRTLTNEAGTIDVDSISEEKLKKFVGKSYSGDEEPKD